MKTLRIAAVLVVLLCMSGCTVTKAFQDTPAPTFPSAGKEIIIGTKKTAEEIRKEAEKTVTDTAMQKCRFTNIIHSNKDLGTSSFSVAGVFFLLNSFSKNIAFSPHSIRLSCYFLFL